MSTAQRVLALLADGVLRPGRQLAAEVGVSLGTIRRAIGHLRKLGLDVITKRTVGYQLANPIDVLCAVAIRGNIDPNGRTCLTGIDTFLDLGSTNDYLLRRSSCDFGKFRACVAEAQTAGRGRRGRTWISPPGSNLYLSVRRDFATAPTLMQGFSLAVGVWVAQTLAELGISGVGLKWPNDLLLGGKKFGGILVEVVNAPIGGWRLVCGLGINVSMSAQASARIGQPWTDLASTGCQAPDRNLLAGRFISRFIGQFSHFEREGFSAYRDAWTELDIGLNREAVLHTPRAEVTGIYRGVDRDGALLLDSGNEIKSFVSGEVSLRLCK